MTFDWPDFLAPLDPLVMLSAFVIGLAMGWFAHRGGQHLGNDHLFWTVAKGFVFFVPLAILRAAQGSDVWERFLATLILWVLFALGTWIGSARP